MSDLPVMTRWIAVGPGAIEQVEPLVHAADAAHPTGAVADAHHADDALGALVDGGSPDDGGAAVAGAVDADSVFVHLRLLSEEGHGGLHIRDTAVGSEAQRRDTLALAPALVVEGHDDVASVVQHASVVGQVQVLDAGVAVAEQHGSTLFPGGQIAGCVDVPCSLNPSL